MISDLGYLACWLSFTMYRSSSKVKVKGKTLQSHEKHIAKVVSATPTELFLVYFVFCVHIYNYHDFHEDKRRLVPQVQNWAPSPQH